MDGLAPSIFIYLLKREMGVMAPYTFKKFFRLIINKMKVNDNKLHLKDCKLCIDRYITF